MKTIKSIGIVVEISNLTQIFLHELTPQVSAFDTFYCFV